MPSDPHPASNHAETLAHYTSEALIVPELQGQDSATVIQELTRALCRGGWIPDPLAFYHAAVNMEFLHSSAREGGLALPYARSSEVSQVCFAVGRRSHPISWKAGNRIMPVPLVFLLALPATEASDYISVMLSLGGLHENTALMRKLLEARSSAEILAVLRSIKLVLPRSPSAK